MSKVRTFTFSAVLALTTGLFVACGDGEPNIADSSQGGSTATCPGSLECSGVCVNSDIDPANCGACGTKCADGESCSAGECVPTDCPKGQVSCDGACVTLSSDQNNCGACGTTCAVGELCSAGKCTTSCGEGLIACDNTCVNPSSDPKYCGATSCAAGAGGAAQGVECGAKEACVIGECRSFTPTWAPGQQLDSATTKLIGSEQSIGMDSSGNAVVLFRQQTVAGDDNSQRAYAANYDAATKTFGTPVLLDAGTARVRNLKVAVSKGGDALAVWIDGPNNPSAQDDVNCDPGTTYCPSNLETDAAQVKVALYNHTTGTWGSAARLDSISAAADTPDVAIDADGDAVVAWSQRQSAAGEYSVYVRRRVAGTFAAAEEIADQGLDRILPHIALNDAGALAVQYTEKKPDTYNSLAPMVSRYTAGNWTTPVDLRPAAGLVTDDEHWNLGSDIGVDSNGNFTVVWANDHYSKDLSVLMSEFNATAGTWSEAVAIENLDGSTDPSTSTFQTVAPKISVAPDGSAFVTFQVGSYNTGSWLIDSYSDVYGVIRSSGGTWGGPTLLGTIVASSNAANPQVRADGSGNAFVFWAQAGAVKARRYVGADVDWAALTTLSDAGVVGVDSPDLAAAPNGNALASWVQGPDGDQHIFVARFD